MARKTKIAWADHTFNPWWGCTRVSDGCRHCYAEQFAVQRMRLRVWGPTAERRFFGDKHWAEPLSWARQAAALGVRRRVFCASMADVFEDRPDLVAPRQRLFELIRATPALDWMLLTKRPEHIAPLLPCDWDDGWPNVWLGATIEHAAMISRAALLRAVPCRVRFVSYEPALGPLGDLPLDGIHWVIYGGESGAYARADDPQWARDMRAKCQTAGVAFFYKQACARDGLCPTLDGETIHEFPVANETPLPAGLYGVRGNELVREVDP